MAIITICRGTDTGGKSLADRLGQDLGYRVLSREELLSESAKSFCASEDQLKSALHQKPGFLEGRGVKRWQYINCVQATMARAVQGDNVVYHGQAGHLLLCGIPHHMRVRVVADMEYRIRATLGAGAPNRDRAIESIEELDRTRAGWMRSLHGVDINDPTMYDLIINLEHVSIPTASTIVAQAVARDFQTTPAGQKLMDDLVLASEVRARVGLDRTISEDRLAIDADDGVVTVSANVRCLADAERAKELIRQMPGVTDVLTNIDRGW